MSDHTQIIRAIQLYLDLDADGIAGPKTWAAIYKYMLGEHVEEQVDLAIAGSVDPQSASHIQTLLPIVRRPAIELLRKLEEKGLTFHVTSGTRTDDEQNDLYEQGRTKPGKIVTNARAGQSNHNFGLAFDITQFKGKVPVYESVDYKTAGAVGKSSGLLWGGDWHSDDEPHFEHRPNYAKDMTEDEALAEYRNRKRQGIAIA